MDIRYGILHAIHKESGSDQVTIDHRDECLVVDDLLNKLGGDVLSIYGKKSNSYGTFDPDTIAHPFSATLNNMLDKPDEDVYVEFSKKTIGLIANRMQTEQFATGGYVLILNYQNQGKGWLMVVMLKLKPGTGVDEKTKELTGVISLDIDHLHEAARIDIQKWRAADQPYLSFVKQKASGGDITRYFRLALGCTEFTDSVANTKESMRAIKDFARNRGWNGDRTRQARSAYYEYCNEKKMQGENVNLTALSAIICDQDPSAFRDFIRENEYKVNDEFEPSQKEYRKFKRLSGKVGTVNVSFDVDDLVNNRIVLNPDAHSLTITNISAQLEQKIQDAMGNGNAD